MDDESVNAVKPLSPGGGIVRDEKGRIAAGSGAALGASSTRRLGTGAASEVTKLRRLIEPKREVLVERLADIANGQGPEAVKAAEILLGYLAARPRPTAELVHVPGIASGDTLEQKCLAVLDSVSHGEITSTAARELLAVISDLSKIVEVAGLKERVRALEGKPTRPVPTPGKPDGPDPA